MAAFAAGFFSHVTAGAQSLANITPNSSPTPAVSASDGTSSSSAASSTISANDFLTLLVTEMKNQDPTANTDPNEYINQLVNVNSLEQLIDINQNLRSALGDPSSNSKVSGVAEMAEANSSKSSAASQQGTQSLSPQASISNPTAVSNLNVSATALKLAPGNLTVPKAAPAAQSLAHALDGNSHARSTAAGLR